MARKITYLQKNRDTVSNPFADIVYPTISPSQMDVFEEGQTLLINKPLHATSFDIIKQLRRILKIRKIGHAGTLDPLATGLVIVCTGKNTRFINDYMAQRKIYTGTITLGATTASFDLETPVENLKPFEHITQEKINEMALAFLGEIDQIPPKYSAIKKDGVPLYELARAGVDIEIKIRKVIIYKIEFKIEILPLVSFYIECGTGTYIRSIAQDFGEALQTGAYLSKLERTQIGDIKLLQAQTVKAIAESIY